jgi:hypothetical protein
MPQYNGVWTIEAAAQAQSNQQWVTDPNFRNTTLLLQADNAANSAQNNTFLDSSSNSFAITRNGNTTQGTFTPFSQSSGWWSNYFDGSGDNLLTPSNAAFNPSGSDITVDFFVYFTRYANTANVIFEVGTSLTGDMQCNVQNTGEVRFTIGGSVGSVKSGFVLNAWNYITCVKSGTNFTVYLNGVAGTTVSLTPNSKTQMYIGQQSGGNTIEGYISNFRYVRGSAIVPTAIPTSPLTAITNTSLLTCQSNRFVDNSSNSFALTVTGNTSVQAFSPFAPQYQWTAPVIGGSGYFDGTGDYLAFPTSDATLLPSTGQFTFELWFYSSTTAFQTLFSYGTTTGRLRVFTQSGGLQVWNGATQFTAGTTTLIKYGGWNHVVVQRNATNLVTYVNGTRDYNAANSTNFSGGSLQIGAEVGADLFTGYISGFSYIKGSATYSGTPITLPTVPPLPAGTTACLNFTNAGIYDGKMANNLETVGNAQVSTSVVKYGSGSMFFDGTGDYLFVPRWTGINANENFTAELWVNLTAAQANYRMMLSDSNGNSSKYWTLNATGMEAQFGTIVSTSAVCTFTFTPGVWYHLALVRNNGVVSMYVNGIAQTVTYPNQTASYLDQNSILQVGRWLGATTTYEFFGYMDDLRITKGIARYTANFIPPQVALPRQ